MIYEFLGKGKGAARTARELAKALNVNARDITQAVQRERANGAPICAINGDPQGYYIAESREEMRQYCESLKRRELEIAKTRRACEKAARRLPRAATGATEQKNEICHTNRAKKRNRPQARTAASDQSRSGNADSGTY